MGNVAPARAEELSSAAKVARSDWSGDIGRQTVGAVGGRRIGGRLLRLGVEVLPVRRHAGGPGSGPASEGSVNGSPAAPVASGGP